MKNTSFLVIEYTRKKNVRLKKVIVPWKKVNLRFTKSIYTPAKNTPEDDWDTFCNIIRYRPDFFDTWKINGSD